ncbi:MAG: hypothetical protein OXF11_09240 [Deltaproteobacteria bacterium]|nr:hypothetical protein [Deltaproteobacteria bacterium]
MEIQIQKPQRENLFISFELSPFITDWVSARTAFMDSVARQLGDSLTVRPHDFSTNDSTELGESRCTYRIFGGGSTIVLRPATLELNFGSLTEGDYPTVEEIVRQSIDILSRDLGCYARDHVSINSSEHVPLAENGLVNAYLSEFAWKKPTDTAATEVGIEYSPAAKVIFSDNHGRWSLQRTVEKSVVLPDGLFITTTILITSQKLTSFDEQAQLWRRLNNLANQATGLTFLGDNPA